MVILNYFFAILFTSFTNSYAKEALKKAPTPVHINEINGQYAAKIIANVTNKLPAEISVFLRYEILKKKDILEIASYASIYPETYCQIEFETEKNQELIKNTKKSKRKEIQQKIKNKQNQLVNDNEVDAIRHFLVSGIMAGRYGYGIARAFMVAHEHHQIIHPREMMDLYNNELGLLEGGQLFESGRSVKELSDSLLKLAIRYLQDGRLSVIKSDNQLKPRCRYENHYPNFKHETVDIGSFFILKDSLPQYCFMPRRSICNKRKTTKSRAFCLYYREARINQACKDNLRDLLSVNYIQY